ncbi:low-molecular-weight cysteine-rich 69, partial [Prunus dulcis]
MTLIYFFPMLKDVSRTGPMVAEGKVETKETSRTCESLSTKFKGPCFRSSNCANICEKEGFKGGKCVGFQAEMYVHEE